MRWTSRKFWSMWIVEYFMRELLLDRVITSSQFMEFSLFLFGAYFAAAVGKSAVDKWSGKFTEPRNQD